MKVHLLLGISLLCTPIASLDLLQLSMGTAKRHAKNILDNSEDTQCTRDLKTLLADLETEQIWALKMVDAVGKPPAGFLMGNIMAMGNYDECVGIKHGGIKGKYCTTVLSNAEKHRGEWDFLANGGNFIKALGIDFDRRNVTEMLDSVKWTMGVCVPASCASADLQAIANQSEIALDSKLHLTFYDQLCEFDDQTPLPAKAIFFICFMCVIIGLMVLSTVYDVYYNRRKHDVDVLLAFSVYSNGRKIFSMEPAEDNLGAVNGVRVLSMAWVLFGHTYMLSLFFPSVNSMYIFEWRNNLSSLPVLGAPLSVDTFFTISGFLVIYLYLTATVTKRISLSLTMFYVHRIIRLTPSLLVVILFYLCLFEHVGSGPYWFSLRQLYVKNCEKYWWSTLLYVQNYYNSLNECVNQSWYLAVDTQLYFLAPVLLYGLTRRARRTVYLLGAAFVASAIAAFAITYKYNVGAAPFEAGKNYFYYIYHATHIRCTAWMVGALWGFQLFRTRHARLGLRRRSLLLLWAGHLLAMYVVVYEHLGLTRYGRPYDPVVAGFFNALARPVWAQGVCWIMYACIKGHGGVLNDFLSMRPFLVISRLNYSMFLMHLPIMLIMTTQKRNAVYISNLYCCFEFVSYYVLTLLVSIFWVLAFESPIITLEKYFFRNERSKFTTSKTGGGRSHVVDLSGEKKELAK